MCVGELLSVVATCVVACGCARCAVITYLTRRAQVYARPTDTTRTPNDTRAGMAISRGGPDRISICAAGRERLREATHHESRDTDGSSSINEIHPR